MRQLCYKSWRNVWHICQYHPLLCITHMLIRILKGLVGPMWWPSLESAHLTNHRKKEAGLHAQAERRLNPEESASNFNPHWRRPSETQSVESDFYWAAPGRLALWTAAVIFAHRSFLQLLVRRREERRFWNSFWPLCVHIKAWRGKWGEEKWTRENLSRVKYDSSEVLVFSRREVVESLVDALVVHLQNKCVKLENKCYSHCPQGVQSLLVIPGSTSAQGWSSKAAFWSDGWPRCFAATRRRCLCWSPRWKGNSHSPRWALGAQRGRQQWPWHTSGSFACKGAQAFWPPQATTSRPQHSLDSLWTLSGVGPR